MPPTALVPVQADNAYSTTGYALPMVAADSANGNTIAVSTGTYLLFVRNTSGSDRALTITSQPDPRTGRLGNVSMNISGNAFRVYRLAQAGWADTDGLISLNGHADLQFGVVRISGLEVRI